ncbi:efflux RND transporter periplasmic adaptor subunit [Pseudomonas fluorescens]|uniref:Efflux RND transporter periplasmic adaptor subunit n=1 Tax=Pseudomonas fluorescens TaxID=294 RepID=A0A944DJ66_PSEFL|nr:efflux RND transporter periplasmic adaptor subunit [Pseudomonas fluorescens]MBT2298031.1 efflux RND transporter periplasmic adaptor subunit [Pseudomonas fluorescens]MBT2309846.1 efflux RND transporter periplasmic adaptor subunit [Pseudomonas fluorescens]MBT2315009.1 efflux RND transporter periplasmic adaptor subunit [Pseudomonas fluorescens]MBT2327915.1 efflux RND transporter periplasmic adaptor subunit [Pseudomonas fluorescens]MBT2345662.1 efflux RND transporter periplasmic adaptor subunit
MSSFIRRLTRVPAWALGVLALVALAGFAISMRSPVAQAKTDPAPLPQVQVMAAIKRDVVDWQSYTGRLVATDTVVIKPLVAGTLISVHFKDGALLRKGDLMFEIDPRPYAATLQQAQAALVAAKSMSLFAQKELQRYEHLITSNAIAKTDLDKRIQSANEAQARVNEAQARVELARLDLEHTRILAPFDGRASRVEVTPGNIVDVGERSTALTNLVSISPIYADFDVDEQTFLRYLGNRPANDPVPVMLGLAHEEGYPRKGNLSSLDNRLDTRSATIRVRASFDNSNGELRPGLFARVLLPGSASRSATLVEDSAIGTDQDKKYVLVVDAQGRVQYRQVKPGIRQGALRVIDQGIEPEEQVVVSSLHLATPGTQVAPIHAPSQPQAQQ